MEKNFLDPKENFVPNAYLQQLERAVRDIKANHHAYMTREMKVLAIELRRLSAEYSVRNRYAAQLLKLFDRFARDFTQHMDAEEQVLFPYLLRHVAGESTGLTPTTKEVIAKLAFEDRVVGSEFGRIIDIARLLIEHGLRSAYEPVLEKLLAMEANLARHTEKEREFVSPLVDELVGKSKKLH